MENASSVPFDVITIGRSSIDLYANDIGKPFVEIESFAAYVGGSPTNIAVGAQRLGLRTALLTAVGHDPVGDFILRFLEKEGVDTSYIPRKSARRTSAVLLGIEPPDRFPLVFYRDNCADIALDIGDVLNTPITETRVVEISGTALSQEPSRSAVFLAAEQAHRAGARVVLDIDFRADQWHDPRAFGVTIRALLPLVDVAIGTEDEVNAAVLQDPEQIRIAHSQISAPEISGDLDVNVSHLLERGPQALIVKRGAKGASAFLQNGDVIDAPGFPVEVLNVLGAGDAFASGFIYGLVKGWSWYNSMRMGNACGAIVVTRHGCANFMGYEDEVLDFVRSRGGFSS